MFVLYQIFNNKYSTNILYRELLFTNIANFIDKVDFFHKQFFDRLLLILIRFLLKKRHHLNGAKKSFKIPKR